MRAVDIIAKKRDGESIAREDITAVVSGYTSGDIPDYQMAALLMAVYLRGLDPAETLALTEAMLHSGIVVDLSDLADSRVDKHSTGGVGDKTSLIVAPVVAAAGVVVPMISGRALAHSGGTLDKLESIPGFRTNLSIEEFRKALQETGAALIGQTEQIAPADKKLYALRDVTATVACRPLMAASIMSKKMAEGITGLVLDVKVGNGAFMKKESEALGLAEVMLDIARRMNSQAVALLTDMNQPLGRAVGNSLEVIEALETLKNRGPHDLNQLCRELSAEMLLLGGAVNDLEDGRRRYDDLIKSGAALEKMRTIIERQSGDPRVVDHYDLLPGAGKSKDVLAYSSGFVGAIDTEAIGHASMLLGAGRLRLDSKIDYGAGISINAKIGDSVNRGDALSTIHFNVEDRISDVEAIVTKAYTIVSDRIQKPNLLKARLG
jgi:pyrimidine-nucleoside phosphorylase